VSFLFIHDVFARGKLRRAFRSVFGLREAVCVAQVAFSATFTVQKVTLGGNTGYRPDECPDEKDLKNEQGQSSDENRTFSLPPAWRLVLGLRPAHRPVRRLTRSSRRVRPVWREHRSGWLQRSR